jgi:hypothetical protein
LGGIHNAGCCEFIDAPPSKAQLTESGMVQKNGEIKIMQKPLRDYYSQRFLHYFCASCLII